MSHAAETSSSRAARRGTDWRWWLALAAIFAFRLLYGLCFEFFFEDETQIFLIGLRAYARHAWPYFGPDVVWTQSQIPGALQGLLVAVPLWIAPWPESPFVLLTLLSTAALGLLAWYIGQRLPSLPKWLIWGWLMTVPWTVNFSTSMINTSYILPGALVFFVAFFEAHPRFSLGRIPAPAAFAMMGAAIVWVMQVHMSWPLFGPYVVLVLLARWRLGVTALLRDLAAMAAGALLPALLLMPTFARFGLHAGSGGAARNLHFHWVGVGAVLSTTARVLSFASLEVLQFIGTDTAKRVLFVLRHLWIAPLLAIVGLVGVVHPLWMLGMAVIPRSWTPREDWGAVKGLAALTIAIVVGAYCFVMEPPQAHAFYAVAPVAFVYAAYCYAFLDSPRWRRIAGAILAINVVYQLGVALILAPERSMYRNRIVVAEAVSRPDPDVLAHRREYAMDAIPGFDTNPRRDPRDELFLDDPVWALHAVRAVTWTVTVRNESARWAYRDLWYRAYYRDAAGRVLDTRNGLVRDVFQPGEPRRVEVNDGSVIVPFTSASIEIVLAETVEPLWKKAPPRAISQPGERGSGDRAALAAFRR